MRELLPSVFGGEGKPLLPQKYEREKALEYFENLEWSTWPEANLLPTLRYMRGNKSLNPPRAWLMVFPCPCSKFSTKTVEIRESFQELEQGPEINPERA